MSNSFNNSYDYQFIDQALSWDEHVNNAINRGGFLATITNHAENQYIKLKTIIMNKYFQYIYINVLIFNFAFCQLAKQYYVNEKINTLDRTLSNKIYDLSKSFDLKLSEMENNKNNISHISKLYPNGKPKEVFLYKAENIFKHNPYKIQAKVQYNIDGNIKIIDKFYDNGGRMLTATYSEKMPKLHTYFLINLSMFLGINSSKK